MRGCATRVAWTRVPVIVISEMRLSPDTREMLNERQIRVPMYTDVDHQAQREFANFGTPTYFVLDANSHICFSYANPDDIVTELAAMDVVDTVTSR